MAAPTAKGRTRRAWSGRSLNAAIAALRLVSAYGCDRKELSHNVAGSMKKVPRSRREMQTYTPDGIRRVLRAADKDRNGHLCISRCRGFVAPRSPGCVGLTSTSMPGTITIARNRVQVGASTVDENEPKTAAARPLVATTSTPTATTGPTKQKPRPMAGESVTDDATHVSPMTRLITSCPRGCLRGDLRTHPL